MKAKAYIGLWSKEDKNGNTYLNGSDDNLIYFVFKDKKNPEKRTLFSSVKGDRDSGFTPIGLLETGTNDRGDYYKTGNTFIFQNDRREKDTHPHFNMVIYEADDAVNS